MTTHDQDADSQDASDESNTTEDERHPDWETMEKGEPCLLAQDIADFLDQPAYFDRETTETVGSVIDEHLDNFDILTALRTQTSRFSVHAVVDAHIRDVKRRKDALLEICRNLDRRHVARAIVLLGNFDEFQRALLFSLRQRNESPAQPRDSVAKVAWKSARSALRGAKTAALVAAVAPLLVPLGAIGPWLSSGYAALPKEARREIEEHFESALRKIMTFRAAAL